MVIMQRVLDLSFTLLIVFLGYLIYRSHQVGRLDIALSLACFGILLGVLYCLGAYLRGRLRRDLKALDDRYTRSVEAQTRRKGLRLVKKGTKDEKRR